MPLQDDTCNFALAKPPLQWLVPNLVRLRQTSFIPVLFSGGGAVIEPLLSAEGKALRPKVELTFLVPFNCIVCNKFYYFLFVKILR